MAKDCIFCRIASGEVKSDMLHGDDHCFVVRDIAPKAPVHLLIIPRQHFTYLAGMSAEHYPMIGAMFDAARLMAEREGVTDSGYRLVVNQGDNAGQQVPHLHLHLLAGRRLGAMG